MTIEELHERIDAADLDEVLIVDGFEDAVIGHADCRGHSVLVYSVDKIAEIIRRDNPEMKYADIMEHISCNIFGAFMGDHTPIFVHSLPEL